MTTPTRQTGEGETVVRELACQFAFSISSLGFPVGMGIAPPEESCMKAAQAIVDLYGSRIASDLTRERDEAVRLLREIAEGPGIECIPDTDIQGRITAFLASLQAQGEET